MITITKIESKNKQQQNVKQLIIYSNGNIELSVFSFRNRESSSVILSHGWNLLYVAFSIKAKSNLLGVMCLHGKKQSKREKRG